LQISRYYHAATRVCKPGSVLTAIYLDPGSLLGSSRLLEAVGPTYVLLHGVAPDRVYSVKPMFPWAGWALTPPFHPYHRQFAHIIVHFAASSKAHTICGISSFPSNPLSLGFDGSPVLGWRYISVALVLRSPSAGVTRYPCPVEPGLSSRGAFRHSRAAVRPGRGNIVQQTRRKVKCPCKFFFRTV